MSKFNYNDHFVKKSLRRKPRIHDNWISNKLYISPSASSSVLFKGHVRESDRSHAPKLACLQTKVSFCLVHTFRPSQIIQNSSAKLVLNLPKLWNATPLNPLCTGCSPGFSKHCCIMKASLQPDSVAWCRQWCVKYSLLQTGELVWSVNLHPVQASLPSYIDQSYRICTLHSTY